MLEETVAIAGITYVIMYFSQTMSGVFKAVGS